MVHISSELRGGAHDFGVGLAAHGNPLSVDKAVEYAGQILDALDDAPTSDTGNAAHPARSVDATGIALRGPGPNFRQRQVADVRKKGG